MRRSVWWLLVGCLLVLAGCGGGKGIVPLPLGSTATPTIALPPRQTTTTACPAPPALLDSRASATAYVQSFYNAIDRGEYPRAYGYLIPQNPLPTPVPPAPTATPAPSEAEWQAGYAHTACVLITFIGAEAGVTSKSPGYAGIGTGTVVPVSFTAVGTDGGLQQFTGTYAVRYDPAQGIAASGYLDEDFAHVTQVG